MASGCTLDLHGIRSSYAPSSGNNPIPSDPVIPRVRCELGIHGERSDCSDDNVCTEDKCVNGWCTNESLTGTKCNDGDVCTEPDVCLNGVCVGQEIDCDDDDSCTEDYCESVWQKAREARPVCRHDRIICEQDDNPCTKDECVDGACRPTPDTGDPCDDGDSCTDGDRCVNGVCVGTPSDCSDDNPCTDDICTASGGCANPPNNNPCNDGDACTVGDTCRNGVCVGGDPIDCDDGDLCTTEVGCEPEAGCIRDWPCDDGDPCTDDSCAGGICTNSPVSCDSLEECDGMLGTPNTGQTAIHGQMQSSIFLCLPGSANIPVVHNIVTHDTPRARNLHGMLRLSLVSGDPAVVDISYLGQPYALGSPIPVVEPGHNGCGQHTWHKGEITFIVTALNVGEVTLKAQVDPDPECCEGDGVPTVEAQVTVAVVEVMLSFANVAEEDAEDPGGFLILNDDDDNDSDVPDKDDPGPTPGENDLRLLTVTADGRLEGTLELSVASGGSRIRLYENPDRSNQVTLPMSWDLLGIPKTFSVAFYVEGYQPSAALRDVELKLTFTGDGSVCENRVALTVISATLTLNPSSISTTTLWPDMPADSFSEVAVQWDPPGYEGTLDIVLVENPDGDYVPPSDGNLTPLNPNPWRYDAFDEPQNELCPEPVKVWIAAMGGDEELDRKSIRVLPVRTFFITGANSDFWADYYYLVWKYATVLATTGGTFSSETISADAAVYCGVWPLGTDAYGCTTCIPFLGCSVSVSAHNNHRLPCGLGARLVPA